jgi:hypothetical protein
VLAALPITETSVGGATVHIAHCPALKVRVPEAPIAAAPPVALTPSVLVACELQISRYLVGARDPNGTGIAVVVIVVLHGISASAQAGIAQAQNSAARNRRCITLSTNDADKNPTYGRVMQPTPPDATLLVWAAFALAFAVLILAIAASL